MDNILFIGDSLTYGYGVPSEDCWVSLLKKELNYTPINQGIDGDTTTSILARNYELLSLYNPLQVFIMGGTNDLLSGRKVSSIVANIEEIIKEILDNNIVPYIGIPPYVHSHMAQKFFMPSDFYKHCSINLPKLREELIKLSSKYNIDYIDFYTPTKYKEVDTIYLDGIHLNKEGNVLLKEEFLKVFKG